MLYESDNYYHVDQYIESVAITKAAVNPLMVFDFISHRILNVTPTLI